MSLSSSDAAAAACEGDAPSAAPDRQPPSCSSSDVQRSSQERQRRRSSAGSAAVPPPLSQAPVPPAVQRLYHDPYADAMRWRSERRDSATGSARNTESTQRKTSREGREVSTTAAGPAVAAVDVRAKSPEHARQSQRRARTKTVLKQPPGSAASSAGRPSPSPPPGEEEDKEGKDEDKEQPQVVDSAPTTTAEEAAEAAASGILCVVLPDAAARATPRTAGSSARGGGGRLELRARGLTALPCLHACHADVVGAGESGADTKDAEAAATPHGSGDLSAARLHALNLRQNAIQSLLAAPFARTNTSGPSPSLLTAAAPPCSSASLLPLPAPRSSPLQCYAHVASLDLTHNALGSIAGIEALRCLRSLRLAFNQLTSLSPLWASPYVAEVEVLDVSANRLTELMTAEDVQAMASHRIRVVTHPTQANSTTGAQRSTKATTTYKAMRLRVLYASSNALTAVPGAIYTLTRLADLRLGKNQIASVPDSFPSRACLPVLARLDLSNNCLPHRTVEAVAARAAGAGPEPALRVRRPSPPPPASTSGEADSDDASDTPDGGARASLPPPSQPLPKGNTAGIQLEISNNLPAAEGSAVRRGRTVKSTLGDTLTPAESRVAAQHAADLDGASGAGDGEGPQAPPSLSSPSGPSGDKLKAPTTRSTKAGQTPLTEEGSAVSAGQDGGAAAAKKPRRSPQLGEGKREAAAAAKSNSKATRAARSATAATSAAADATPTPLSYEAAVTTPAVNVVCVNMQLCVTVLQQRLERTLASPTAAAGHDDDEAQSPQQQQQQSLGVTLNDLLSSLSDSVGSCVTGRVVAHGFPSAGSPAAPAAGLKSSSRLRLLTSARVMTALLQCLPPAGLISFPEDAQARSAPLLILTHISTDMVRSAQPTLLLYQVLAHHLLQACLCTPRTSQGGSGGSPVPQRVSPVPFFTAAGGGATLGDPAASASVFARYNSKAKDHTATSAAAAAKTSPTTQILPQQQQQQQSGVPTAEAHAAQWRSSSDRAGWTGSAMSSGGGGGAARPLAFAVPLQVVHVLTSDSTSEESMSSAVMWTYVRWRQCWEAAVSRRRVKHHDTYVYEAAATSSDGEKQMQKRKKEKAGSPSASSPSPSLPSSASSPTSESSHAEAALTNPADSDATAAAAAHGGESPSLQHCAAALCPFPCSPAVVRLFEWRRLLEVRPALYSPLPQPWEVLYDTLSRRVTDAACSPQFLPLNAVEPVAPLHGRPVPLACLLLCGAEYPLSCMAGGGHNSSSSTTAVAARRAAQPAGTLSPAAVWPGSGAPRRSSTGRCVVAEAARQLHNAARLSARVEAEVATVADEQVPCCAMAAFSAAEVERSQAAAVTKLQQASEATACQRMLEEREEGEGEEVEETPSRRSLEHTTVFLIAADTDAEAAPSPSPTPECSPDEDAEAASGTAAAAVDESQDDESVEAEGPAAAEGKRKGSSPARSPSSGTTGSVHSANLPTTTATITTNIVDGECLAGQSYEEEAEEKASASSSFPLQREGVCEGS